MKPYDNTGVVCQYQVVVAWIRLRGTKNWENQKETYNLPHKSCFCWNVNNKKNNIRDNSNINDNGDNNIHNDNNNSSSSNNYSYKNSNNDKGNRRNNDNN